MIGADPIATSERQLQAAAETRSMDRGDRRNSQLFQATEQILSETADAFRVRRRLELRKLLDVRPRDESVRLAGDQYESLNERIVIDAREHFLELAGERWTQRVDRRARNVDRH